MVIIGGAGPEPGVDSGQQPALLLWLLLVVLQAQNQALIQGNNLPLEERKRTQDRNWQQFREKFGVYPDDYRKQQVDRDNGQCL